MGLLTPRWKIEAQNLTYRLDESRFVISDKQLTASIKMFVSGHMKIVKDSQKLVNETKKPAIFFGRLDTLVEHAEQLCKLDAIKPGLLKPSPTPQLRTIKEKLPTSIDEMIDRCWKETKAASAGLKSDKAKRNKFEKLFAELDKFDSRMYSGNREKIKQLKAEVDRLYPSKTTDA